MALIFQSRGQYSYMRDLYLFDPVRCLQQASRRGLVDVKFTDQLVGRDKVILIPVSSPAQNIANAKAIAKFCDFMNDDSFNSSKGIVGKGWFVIVSSYSHKYLQVKFTKSLDEL